MNFPAFADVPAKLKSLVERMFNTRSSENTSAQPEVTSWDAVWRDVQVKHNRTSISADVWQMYREDDRVRAAIDGLGEDSSQSDDDGRPFELDIRADDEAVADEIRERTDTWLDRPTLSIRNRIGDMMKYSALDGNRFYEIIIDWTADEVSQVKYVRGIPEGFIVSPVYMDGELAGYVQKDITTDTVKNTFAPWQIIHFMWDSPDERLGASILSSGRKNWKKLMESEDGMHTARKERAYLKIAHIFRDASIEQIQAYMQQYQKAVQAGKRGPQTDLFSNSDLKALDPNNAQLSNIADVEYFENKLFAGMRRPKGLFGGFGMDINRATLDRQEQRYIAGTIDRVRKMGARGLLQLIHTQWVLWGYDPDAIGCRIQWTDANVDQEGLLKRTQALGMVPISEATYLEEMGYDPEKERQRKKDEEFDVYANRTQAELGTLTPEPPENA